MTDDRTVPVPPPAAEIPDEWIEVAARGIFGNPTGRAWLHSPERVNCRVVARHALAALAPLIAKRTAAAVAAARRDARDDALREAVAVIDGLNSRTLIGDVSEAVRALRDGGAQ